jgi:hypothetical protein
VCSYCVCSYCVCVRVCVRVCVALALDHGTDDSLPFSHRMQERQTALTEAARYKAQVDVLASKYSVLVSKMEGKGQEAANARQQLLDTVRPLPSSRCPPTSLLRH